MPILLGCIADDFTGASDVANTLARGGMRTRLSVGHDNAFPGDCDAVVIALKTRSTPPEDAVGQSLAALDRLLDAGCSQVVFKYCSTFDSTPQGNIGPVAMALAARLRATGVAVCPAFPATGRTVYQGHLFVGDRLLSESGMERHPLTPMTDPDIRRWLARQTSQAPDHIGHGQVMAGAASIRTALDDAAARGVSLVVVDAISERDLRAIGEACAADRLLTGGSGIAIALPDNFRRAGLLHDQASAFVAEPGPAVVLSGSCSSATQRQVAAYAVDRPALELDVAALLSGSDLAADVRGFIAANRERAPLVYSTADPAKVRHFQERYGRERVAGGVETLFAAIARNALSDGVRRMVVAGGETSGAVVSGLGLENLDLGPEIDPGVPALSTTTKAGQRLALALKSGNFGAEDFFIRALQRLSGEP